jgi:hypothetical protein
MNLRVYEFKLATDVMQKIKPTGIRPDLRRSPMGVHTSQRRQWHDEERVGGRARTVSSSECHATGRNGWIDAHFAVCCDRCSGVGGRSPNVAAGCCLQLLVTRRRAMRGALRAQEWNQKATTPVISFGNKVGGACGPSGHVHGS